MMSLEAAHAGAGCETTRTSRRSSLSSMASSAGDPLSMTWLSDDGVLRPLTGDRDVLDDVGLSLRQITAYLRVFLPDDENRKQRRD